MIISLCFEGLYMQAKDLHIALNLGEVLTLR